MGCPYAKNELQHIPHNFYKKKSKWIMHLYLKCKTTNNTIKKIEENMCDFGLGKSP